MTSPVWPPDDADNPFGLDLRDVHRLVPYRQLPSAPGAAFPADTVVLSEDDIMAWVSQLSGDLVGRLAAAAPIFLTSPSAWGQVFLMGRDAVSNGAASYWEAAFYPEKAGVNDTSYSGVLWQRYLRAIEAIDRLVDTLLSQSGAGDLPGGPDAPIYVEGAGWIVSLFPPVAFPDTIRW
jgi:hypothetical protein